MPRTSSGTEHETHHFPCRRLEIEAAGTRARAEQTTLNEQFRQWLAAYAQIDTRMDRYEAVIEQVRGRTKVGRRLNRETVNER